MILPCEQSSPDTFNLSLIDGIVMPMRFHAMLMDMYENAIAVSTTKNGIQYFEIEFFTKASMVGAEYRTWKVHEGGGGTVTLLVMKSMSFAVAKDEVEPKLPFGLDKLTVGAPAAKCRLRKKTTVIGETDDCDLKGDKEECSDDDPHDEVAAGQIDDDTVDVMLEADKKMSSVRRRRWWRHQLKR